MSATRTRSDVLCIGAGIVGLATAVALAERFRCRVTVLEAEQEVARHQTGRNSGVLHSGLYYLPGSLKAENCVAGRRAMVEFCELHGIPFELCGKLVIAAHPSELGRLDELERRGRANGLEGLRRVASGEIERFEPHARGVAALFVPETGIVDFTAVATALRRRLEELGGAVETSARVVEIRTEAPARGLEVVTGRGVFVGRALINCAGLQSDRVARLAGLRPSVRIVPFRGEYLTVREDRRHLLRNLIYPVPDPRFPFLGVHLTRRLSGAVEAGPNAVLALHREGYDRSVSIRDTASILGFPGFWRLAVRFWRVAASELLRSASPRRFARELERYVPAISADDLRAGGCGIRAQALRRDGSLVDDFVIEQAERQLHVLNAPSPAATSALAIGGRLATAAAESFELPARARSA